MQLLSGSTFTKMVSRCSLLFSTMFSVVSTKTVISPDTWDADNFTVNLYKTTREKLGGTYNIFLAPFSVAVALAMIRDGARGSTATEIQSSLPMQGLLGHAFYSRILRKLIESHSKVILRSAVRIYYEQSYRISPEYVSNAQEHYNATFEAANFKRNADLVRVRINEWVAEQTERKIQDFLERGTITSSTSVALINAVYFKGQWAIPFDRQVTKKASFFGADGVTEVKMMQQDARVKYVFDQHLDADIIGIPYADEKTVMVIVLPKSRGGLSLVEDMLTGPKLTALMESMTEREVTLRLPMFKLERDLRINLVLMAMGINDLFNHSANLSGLIAKGQLEVFDIFHQTCVEVDEGNTEVAQKTNVLIGMSVLKNEQLTFTVDHPFLIVIRNQKLKYPLIIGSVRNVKVPDWLYGAFG